MTANGWRIVWLLLAALWLAVSIVKTDAHYATTNSLVCLGVAWVGPGARR